MALNNAAVAFRSVDVQWRRHVQTRTVPVAANAVVGTVCAHFMCNQVYNNVRHVQCIYNFVRCAMLYIIIGKIVKKHPQLRELQHVQK